MKTDATNPEVARLIAYKLKYGYTKTIILDPSTLAHPKVFETFSKIELSEKYRLVLPTLIYQLLKVKDFDKLFDFLCKWEGNKLDRQKWRLETEHFDWLLENAVSCDVVTKELEPKKKENSVKIEKILRETERHLSDQEKATIEIIKTACVTSLVLSISQRLKHWASKLKNTIIAKAEKSEKFVALKEEFRNEMRRAGWKGRVFAWACKHFPAPFSSDVFDFIMIVFVDGTYKCPRCGKSFKIRTG